MFRRERVRALRPVDRSWRVLSAARSGCARAESIASRLVRLRGSGRADRPRFLSRVARRNGLRRRYSVESCFRRRRLSPPQSQTSPADAFASPARFERPGRFPNRAARRFFAPSGRLICPADRGRFGFKSYRGTHFRRSLQARSSRAVSPLSFVILLVRVVASAIHDRPVLNGPHRARTRRRILPLTLGSTLKRNSVSPNRRLFSTI